MIAIVTALYEGVLEPDLRDRADARETRIAQSAFSQPRVPLGVDRDKTPPLSVRPTYRRCIQLRSRALPFPISRVLLRDRSVPSTNAHDCVKKRDPHNNED